MAQGEIEFVRPLAAAIERMKDGLFRPFRVEVWFVVGFSAWLAWLGQHWDYGSGGKWDLDELDHFSAPQFLLRGWLGRIRAFVEQWEVLLGAVVLAGMILTILVLFAWLSSRAKFIFLENVTKKHAQFVDPWSRASAPGWSLFWWRLVFGALQIAFFGTLAALWWMRAAVPFLEGDPIALGSVVWLTLLAFPIAIACAYVRCFLEHFVVPLMARDGLTANAAWSRFLTLFRENPVPFVLYGLFLIPLWIFVFVACGIVGLLTCCLGWILMALPYIGMVVLLPVYYAYRALGPEFLAQFGPEWDCRN